MCVIKCIYMHLLLVSEFISFALLENCLVRILLTLQNKLHFFTLNTLPFGWMLYHFHDSINIFGACAFIVDRGPCNDSGVNNGGNGVNMTAPNGTVASPGYRTDGTGKYMNDAGCYWFLQRTVQVAVELVRVFLVINDSSKNWNSHFQNSGKQL